MKKVSCLILILFCISTSATYAQKVNDHSFKISKNLTIFNSVLRELDMFYVDSLSYDKMMKSTIDNMLEKLDPYTVYLLEEETEDLTFMTTGEYAGIGALIMKKDKQIVVSEPYEGMSAQRNGIRAGDIIIQVDGENVEDLDVSDVSALLKGTPNTLIKLKLKRPGEKKLVEKEFLREKIQVNPVSYSAMVADKVGYVMLNEFTDRAALEIKNSVSELIKQHKIESLVLDIRNNGGGLIDEAVKIVGYFVPKGTDVVTTKGKNSEAERTYKTPSDPIFPELRLVVLTNRSSASASE